jgi:hypothetical protein
MGTSRESYNLLWRHGRKHTMRDIKRSIKLSFCVVQWRLIFEDTVMPLVCLIAGHVPYDSDGDVACRRCHKYL